MIPILYESNETVFANNGLGRLPDCVRCTVTEERNGIYECEIEYPVTGAHFDDIRIGRIIAVIHDDNGDIQPFDIYRKSEPINGVVTFNANHISYRLSENVDAPFSAANVNDALAGLKTNAVEACPFTFATDKVTAAAFQVETPTTIRALLGGVDGSILDIYGGEYEFDKWTVTLHNRRGSDTGVQIRYGSNIVEYEDETDYNSAYNAVVPYWAGYDSAVVVGSVVTSGQSIPSGRTAVVPMDLSGEYENAPTVAELNTRATSILASSKSWEPNENLTINFIPLWQTAEYSAVAPAQHLNLCDTAEIYFEAYNKAARMKAVRVVYNVLTERYDEIEFGELQTSLSEAVTATLNAKVKKQQEQITGVGKIAGNTAQHFWFNGNGTDTGAHITEVDRETFEADRANGGPNLLARTNGVAVRDGTTELATFSASGAAIGQAGSGRIVLDTGGMHLYDTDGVTTAELLPTSAQIGRPDAQNLTITSESSGSFYREKINYNRQSDLIGSVYGEFQPTDSVRLLSMEVDAPNAAAHIDMWADEAISPTGLIGFYASNRNDQINLTLQPDGFESDHNNRILWAGTPAYITNAQTIDLNGLISNQLSGIVLVWSRYANGAVQNDSWWYEFIPKWHVLLHDGGGVYMETPTGFNNTKCIKYIYVSNGSLTGHASNSATGTGYQNNTRVLRAVLGV